MAENPLGIGLIVSQKSRPLDKAPPALSTELSISILFSELRALKLNALWGPRVVGQPTGQDCEDQA